MQVNLAPELEGKLTRLAAEQGRDVDHLVSDAVERLVDYDTWFMKAIEEGERSADQGELIPHEDVVRRIENLLQRL
jgi:predicted transcriptional regulator